MVPWCHPNGFFPQLPPCYYCFEVNIILLWGREESIEPSFLQKLHNSLCLSLFSAVRPLATQPIPAGTSGLAQMPSNPQTSPSMNSCVEEDGSLREHLQTAPAWSMLGFSAGTAAPMEKSVTFLPEQTRSSCLLPSGTTEGKDILQATLHCSDSNKNNSNHRPSPFH